MSDGDALGMSGGDALGMSDGDALGMSDGDALGMSDVHAPPPHAQQAWLATRPSLNKSSP